MSADESANTDLSGSLPSTPGREHRTPASRVPESPASQSNSISLPVQQGDEEFKFKKGANWQPENVKTLMQWIHISAIYVDVLGESTKFYKRILRKNTIINLILSTLGGTSSLSQFSSGQELFPHMNTLLKVFITASAFFIAFSQGYLKIYNIQDKVEKNVKLQQQWIQFGSTLTSEMQLPVSLRKDALYFIIKMNDTYSQLFKQHVVANRKILKEVAKRNGVNYEVLTLSDLFERTIQAEAQRIDDAVKLNLLENTSVPPQEESVAKKLLLGVRRLIPVSLPKNDYVQQARQSMSTYVLSPNSASTEVEHTNRLQKKISLPLITTIQELPDSDDENTSQGSSANYSNVSDISQTRGDVSVDMGTVTGQQRPRINKKVPDEKEIMIRYTPAHK